MTSLTPQVEGNDSSLVPGAPRRTSHRRFLPIGKKKPESSNLGLKPKILSYLPGFKKSSEELGAKGEKPLLTPISRRSESNRDDSPLTSPSSILQDFEFGPTGRNDEPLTSPDVSSTKPGDSESQGLPNLTRVTHSIPRESPLKRPQESGAVPKHVEKPLQRPVNNYEEIPYSDTVASFAVDISGSTGGRVLEEEKEAIKTLCGGLSRDALTQVEIIPWHGDVEPLIRVDDLETLCSMGGTYPSQLNVSLHARTALSRCSAWFLLTDGEIGQPETRKFSQGICRSGLHGTPCVVILFGYKTARPTGCNISVGLSVFSNAADCLFLFHDIDTTQVYILQSKGVFNAILPSGLHELILDARTLWSDLPLVEYRQLFDLPLPTRQNLQSDELLLQSRRKVNLQDLYRNQIDSSTNGEILASNDNLRSVLLAAQVRGDDDDIRKWILEQSLRGKNILHRERPDVDRQAATIMRALLSSLARSDADSRSFDLQHDLRTAHHQNWFEFVSELTTESHEVSVRSTVVTGVIERMDSNRREMDGGTNSPSMLSPGSAAPRPKNRLLRGNGSTTRMIQLDPINPRDIPPSIRDKLDLPTLKSWLTGENAGALYIQQYRSSPKDWAIQGTCPICKEDDVLLVFLLKSPPTDISTTNFPQPNDRKGLAYPLAMGTYPETDILSSHTSCDSCAHTMVQGKMEIDGDEVIAAIPIMQSAFSGEYQSTTTHLIDTALQKRFRRSSVELVFLSIIQSALADLEGGNLGLPSSALKNASYWIAGQTRLPPSLRMSITGSTPQNDNYGDWMPMITALENSIKNVEQPESPLLQYPIGGFIVLMLIITNTNQVTSVNANQLHVATWHRFLFHLVEKHCGLLAADQSQATLGLKNILTCSPTNTDMDNDQDRHLKPITEVLNEFKQQIEVHHEPQGASPNSSISAKSKRPSIRLPTILQTYLLSQEDLEDFQRLEKLFEPVEDLCSTALHSFLKCLSRRGLPPSLAIEVFDEMRAQADLQDVFVISSQTRCELKQCNGMSNA